MAMEYVQQKYAEAKASLKRSFTRKTLLGFKTGETVQYRLFDDDLERLKWTIEKGIISEPVYAGKIKFDGDTPTVEEIELSKLITKSSK